MEWGNLTTAALAMTLASLFIRWRWPAVPPALATAGLGASLCIAVLSLFNPSIVLAASLALNVALISSGLDYCLTNRAKGGSRNAVTALPTGVPPRTQGQQVIDVMRSAKTDADIAVTVGGPKQIVSALPKVRAAMLSAHKEFQIPLLPEEGSASFDVEAGRRFLECIIPFLKEGHIQEARERATAFIEELAAS